MPAPLPTPDVAETSSGRLLVLPVDQVFSLIHEMYKMEHKFTQKINHRSNTVTLAVGTQKGN